MAEVEFTAETAYHNLGRNRYSKAGGIQVSQVLQEVHLQAINSKGGLTQGLRLVVPLAHLKEFRDAIDDVLAGLGNYGGGTR